MIKWPTKIEGIHTIMSEATNQDELELEVIEILKNIIDFKIFNNDFVEFYIDGTNGCLFINGLDSNLQHSENTKTIHFSVLNKWEYYQTASDFEYSIEWAINASVLILKNNHIKIPFKVLLRDECGLEEVLNEDNNYD